MLTGFQRMGCVVDDASVTTINGPIGRMRKDLRRWLLMTADGRGDAP
ncbi:hypothetical protein [Tianweitania sediminis]|nr:hypothetical protein [Tianweitania sediminis]